MPSQLDWQSGDAHRGRLHEAFAKAAADLSASPTSEPVFGWRDRTISRTVTTGEGSYWLRVVAEQREWVGGEFWTGNVDASHLTGVSKPRVLLHWDWSDGPTCLRAELMTLVPGRPCSATPELHHPLDLPHAWWTGLWTSLNALAGADTARVHLSQADVAHRIRVFFGDRVTDPTITRWTPAHTDLHWANLMAPDCALVDWEGWGVAPAGFDAATLYLHSLLVPEVADRVTARFADLLSARDGLLAQLYLTGRMLLRINSGDYPGLVFPLHRNANRVIDALSRPR